MRPATISSNSGERHQWTATLLTRALADAAVPALRFPFCSRLVEEISVTWGLGAILGGGFLRMNWRKETARTTAMRMAQSIAMLLKDDGRRVSESEPMGAITSGWDEMSTRAVWGSRD